VRAGFQLRPSVATGEAAAAIPFLVLPDPVLRRFLFFAQVLVGIFLSRWFRKESWRHSSVRRPASLIFAAKCARSSVLRPGSAPVRFFRERCAPAPVFTWVFCSSKIRSVRRFHFGRRFFSSRLPLRVFSLWLQCSSPWFSFAFLWLKLSAATSVSKSIPARWSGLLFPSWSPLPI
jgi:hypothetical protein